MSAVLIPVLLFAAQRPTAAASTVLTIFTGVAEVARGNADFALASDGAVLTNGDRVRTDDRGHALITFFDGSTLEIEPATMIQVVTASPNADGSIAIVLGQAIGRTWASVHKLTRTDSKFEIQTPTSTASVRGTGFLTEVLANGDTTVQTTDGIVAVTGQGQTVLVTQGLQTTVRRNEAPTTPAAMPTPSTTLRFGMHSPAYLVVIDPLGRSCGITNPGAAIVRHVPGCVTSAPGSEPQFVDLPDAVPGTYRTVIASIDPGGPFTLSATGIDDRGNVSFDLSLPGDGRPGAVFGSALEVRPGPDGRLSATALAALVTLQGPPSPSDSPSPIPAVFASPNVVPDIALPSLPVATATPSEVATPTPAPTQRTRQRPWRSATRLTRLRRADIVDRTRFDAAVDARIDDTTADRRADNAATGDDRPAIGDDSAAGDDNATISDDATAYGDSADPWMHAIGESAEEVWVKGESRLLGGVRELNSSSQIHNLEPYH